MPDREQELNAFWNALITGEPTTDSPALDAEEQVLLRRLQRMGQVSPVGRSAERAWPTVLARIQGAAGMEHSMQPARTLETAWPAFGVNGRGDALPGRSSRVRSATGRRQRMVTPFATAALLAFMLVASLVAFGPLHPGSSEPPRGQQVPAIVVATPEAGQFEFLWRSQGGPEPIEQAYGLGIDPAGNVWVADGNNDRFQIIAPDGTYRETWGTPGSGDGEFEFLSTASAYGRPYGDIAFDADGNLYVADTGNFRVQKFAPDRTFLRSWGSKGKNDGQFFAPSSIAIGTEGVVYVNDEARAVVQMFTSEGQYLGTIDGTGTDGGEFNVPGGVTVDSAGDLWVADWGSLRIQHFAAEGQWLDTWGHSGSGEGALNKPSDVAVDDQDHVYVVSDLANKIDAFTPDGRFLATTGGSGSGPGQFSDPIGIAVGKDGIVYVSDMNGVQAFQFVLP